MIKVSRVACAARVWSLVNEMHSGSGYRNQLLEWLLLLIALTGTRCCVLSLHPLGVTHCFVAISHPFHYHIFVLFPLPFCRMLLRSKNSKSTAPLTHISMPRCVLCWQHFTASLLQAALACFQVQCHPVAIIPVQFAAAWGKVKCKHLFTLGFSLQSSYRNII